MKGQLMIETILMMMMRMIVVLDHMSVMKPMMTEGPLLQGKTMILMKGEVMKKGEVLLGLRVDLLLQEKVNQMKNQQVLLQLLKKQKIRRVSSLTVQVLVTCL